MNYQFLFNQENLAQLCQDKNSKGNEIFRFNNFYGHADILKKYVGIPSKYPLKAVLEHGVSFSDYLNPAECSARLPVFLASSSYRASLYHERTGKPSIPIGFGFLYAVDVFHRFYGHLLHSSVPYGTVAFPSHSTNKMTAKFDFQAYASLLEDLPDKFKPIVVCIYWKDFLLGHHLEYLKRGFKVVTSGHMNDSLFLLRLYDICRQFKYATSNNIGTCLFASIYSGCSFFYSGVGEIQHEYHKSHPIEWTHQFDIIKEKSFLLFENPVDKTTYLQREFVDYYLGTSFFRSKIELKKILLYCELRDKFFIDFNKRRKLHKLPTCFQRQGEKIIQARTMSN